MTEKLLFIYVILFSISLSAGSHFSNCCLFISPYRPFPSFFFADVSLFLSFSLTARRFSLFVSFLFLFCSVCFYTPLLPCFLSVFASLCYLPFFCLSLSPSLAVFLPFSNNCLLVYFPLLSVSNSLPFSSAFSILVASLAVYISFIVRIHHAFSLFFYPFSLSFSHYLSPLVVNLY